MEKQNLMDRAKQHLLHTYNRYPIVLERGEGVYLYDVEGNKYLDFAAGIAVQSLGYGNRELNEAVKKQVDTLTHTSNLFYNEPIARAAERAVKAAGMERVFYQQRNRGDRGSHQGSQKIRLHPGRTQRP